MCVPYAHRLVPGGRGNQVTPRVDGNTRDPGGGGGGGSTGLISSRNTSSVSSGSSSSSVPAVLAVVEHLQSSLQNPSPSFMWSCPTRAPPQPASIPWAVHRLLGQQLACHWSCPAWPDTPAPPSCPAWPVPPAPPAWPAPLPLPVVMPLQRGQHVAIRGIPQPERHVVARTDQLVPLGIEAHAGDPVCVAHQGDEGIAGGRLTRAPDADGVVVGC